MKAIIGLVLMGVLATSCMVTQECHTYDGSKGHSPSAAATRKSKPAKSHTPFFKLLKFAEKD